MLWNLRNFFIEAKFVDFGIKPDPLKIIRNDPYCLEVIATGLNNIIKQEHEIPQTWCTSKTVLVPRKSKPNIRDLRPIV